jgi:hypothetical protein
MAGSKAGRAEHGQDSTRQIHILTTPNRPEPW